MSKEANIAAAQKMGESVNKGNFEEFHNIFAADVVDHDPAPDQGKGPEGFIKFFTGFKRAFPDLKIEVDHMVTDDDNVSIAYTMTGTQDGVFEGIPATGKKVKIRGMQIAKYNNDGKITERWGSSDVLGILQQIGAVAKPTEANSQPAITGKTA